MQIYTMFMYRMTQYCEPSNSLQINRFNPILTQHQQNFFAGTNCQVNSKIYREIRKAKYIKSNSEEEQSSRPYTTSYQDHYGDEVFKT